MRQTHKKTMNEKFMKSFSSLMTENETRVGGLRLES
jgi:hypothetical protein